MLTLLIISVSLSVVFAFLFLVSRRFSILLSGREICLISFILDGDDSKPPEALHIYCIGVANEDSVADEAVLLLRKKFPNVVLRDVSVRPLGQATLPVAPPLHKKTRPQAVKKKTD